MGSPTYSVTTKFKKYRRMGITEMRPYEEGEDLSIVSISKKDRDNGSPKEGDWIARNIEKHDDQWLVSKEFYEQAKFEEVQ